MCPTYALNLLNAVSAESVVETLEPEPIVGIDLGFTHSYVAVSENGKVRVIPNKDGTKGIPSYVAWSHGKRLVGRAAKHQAILNPNNTVFDVKRLIGLRFDDEIVQESIKRVPYTIVNQDGMPYIEVDKNGDGSLSRVSPQQVLAVLLSAMRDSVASYLGQTVQKAVITVPAYFTDEQRNALKHASATAGLHIERILDDPIAAALAYGLDRSDGVNALIFDSGGRSTDSSIVQSDSAAVEILSTSHNVSLGGDLIDQRLLQQFVDRFLRYQGQDISQQLAQLQELRLECERLKHTLSSIREALLELHSFYNGTDFVAILSRRDLERTAHDVFEGMLRTVEEAVIISGLERENINRVILVGGSSRIPGLQTMLRDYFGGTAFPAEVDPAETLAYGAAVKGEFLNKHEEECITLCNTTPLSLGVETTGGVMNVLIPRNTLLPVRKQQLFKARQESVAIRVFEGESANTEYNRIVLSFGLLVDLLPRENLYSISVSFELDRKGVLHVTAIDEYSGNKESRTVQRGPQQDEEFLRKLIDIEGENEEDNVVVNQQPGSAGALDDWDSSEEEYLDTITPADCTC
eukprot:gb/GECG01010345.1/.p1 GENE.gb/GECG01010345.1/~~gb/GECG01010345.1/.p1  ORF type:complete len:578 (+),score=78.60 gb/GECG01010345.1/:1-1734(+)